MGDAADYDFEVGLDAWLLHLNGECDCLDECPYCKEEEKKEKDDETSKK